MVEYSLKHYAHLGDAVYEVFVREYVIEQRTHSQKQMHDLTTSFVNANFQAQALESLEDFITEEERDLVRRGRNLPTTVNKRNNQSIHRAATAFEVLIGYLHVQNPSRLKKLYELMGEKFDSTLS